MGEYYPGQITIGGKITRTDFIRLFLVAQDSSVGLEYGERSVGSSPQELLSRMTTTKPDHYSPLRLSSIEASYGQFPDLEEFCRKHNLTYHYQCEAKYEYDGSFGWWKPGMKCPNSTTATQGGDATIKLDDILSVLRRNGTAEQKLARLTRHLKKDTPCNLPAMQIIDDGFDLTRWKTIDLED